MRKINKALGVTQLFCLTDTNFDSNLLFNYKFHIPNKQPKNMTLKIQS